MLKLGVLFSGGKDSTYAAWLAKKEGYKISCLISLWSKNKDSFMFHTPAIELTKKQAECINVPLIVQEIKILSEKYKINPAGEGGEFESLVLNCSLFKRGLNVELKNVFGEGNAWRGEFE